MEKIAVDPHKDRAVVRLPFGWIFVAYYVLVICVIFIHELLDDSPASAGVVFTFLIAFIPVGAIASLLVSVIYSYTFTPAGMRGQTLFGTYASIPWENVSSIRRITGFKRLAYLLIPTTIIVPSRGWASIIVFTPMIRTAAFQSAVSQFVPPENPVRGMLL